MCRSPIGIGPSKDGIGHCTIHYSIPWLAINRYHSSVDGDWKHFLCIKSSLFVYIINVLLTNRSIDLAGRFNVPQQVPPVRSQQLILTLFIDHHHHRVRLPMNQLHHITTTNDDSSSNVDGITDSNIERMAAVASRSRVQTPAQKVRT
jgi:hypothetical protein